MIKDPKGRHIPETEDEKFEVISDIILRSMQDRGKVYRNIIAEVTPKQIEDLGNIGIEIDESWIHSIESSSIIHVKKKHGHHSGESLRNQLTIQDSDFYKIPEILESYDSISVSSNKTKSTSNTVIIYVKRYPDGRIFYLEEKRDGRKSLAFHTMYKKMDSSDGSMH